MKTQEIMIELKQITGELIKYNIETQNKLNNMLINNEDMKYIEKINEVKEAIEKSLRLYLPLFSRINK